MRTILKIDFSTGDVITPGEITYSLRLLFEKRTIPILAYNIETVLAEKLESILARGAANTRMRDFYDIYILEMTYKDCIDHFIIRNAFLNTGKKRGSLATMSDSGLILDEIEISPAMAELWSKYQEKFDYASKIDWHEIIHAVRMLATTAAQDS